MKTAMILGGVLVLWLSGFLPPGGHPLRTLEYPAPMLLAERVVIDEPDLIVVTYDAGDGQHYDMRGIALYVEAALDVFPLRDYPSIEQLADAYNTARGSPTLQNGEALEQAFADFAENLTGADEERMVDVTMQAMSVGMLRAQVESMNSLATGFREAFSTTDYPALADFYRAVEALSSNPHESTAERAQAAFAEFQNGLTPTEQDRAEAVEKESAQRLAEEYSDVTIQMMISAWVDQIEQSNRYVRGEIGEGVSDAAFDRLEGEMSYGEVRAIIGREGEREVSTSSNVDGVRTTSTEYLWSWNLERGIIARIHAFFLNDELRVKAYDEVSD